MACRVRVEWHAGLNGMPSPSWMECRVRVEWHAESELNGMPGWMAKQRVEWDVGMPGRMECESLK